MAEKQVKKIKLEQNKATQKESAPVSDETKQRLVQQYRDRADASSKQNEATPSQNYLGEALNTPSWEGAAYGQGYDLNNYEPEQAINISQLQDIVNSMSNDAMAYRDDTNIRPSMLYGYGDAPRDYYSRYDTPAERPEGYSAIYDYIEDAGLEDWADNSNIAASGVDQARLARAFQLMQNANDYDRQRNLEQMTQQYRDRDLYGDALMELMTQRQNPQNNRSLLNEAIQQIRDQEILENRPSPRRRNITGSAVW